MLDIGVIQWADIKHTLTATTHLTHDLFANIFTTTEETQAHVRTQTLNNITPEKFTKECINNLLGLWSKPKLHSYCVETVSYTEDLKRSGPAFKRPVVGSLELHDYIFQIELMTNTSMRPIHQITLDMEHICIARAWRIARKFAEPRYISACVTDAVVLNISNAQRKKLRVAVESQQYTDGTNIYRLRDTETCMICTTGPPTTEKFEIQPNNRTWAYHFESNIPIEEVARSIILNDKKGVFLQGFGRTGRTYCAKRIASDLLNRGNKVIVQATRTWQPKYIVVQGCTNGTLHHCLHKNRGFRGYVIIDEVSQIPLVLWAAILKWQLSGARFIMLGDFRSQFGPAFNLWRQHIATGNVQDAPFFMRICNYNRSNVTTYRRGNNLSCFQLYTGMVGAPVDHCIRTVMGKFPKKSGTPHGS